MFISSSISYSLKLATLDFSYNESHRDSLYQFLSYRESQEKSDKLDIHWSSIRYISRKRKKIRYNDIMGFIILRNLIISVHRYYKIRLFKEILQTYVSLSWALDIIRYV